MLIRADRRGAAGSVLGFSPVFELEGRINGNFDPEDGSIGAHDFPHHPATTETDRTLFFDFLPLELGNIRGFRTRFHLYTVPGQVFYDASRKLILKGVDGVIFVADSQDARMDANMESVKNLEANLRLQGYELKDLPYVLQLNKRDLPDATNRDQMVQTLTLQDEPVFDAVATTGVGVFETLKSLARMVLLRLKKTA